MAQNEQFEPIRSHLKAFVAERDWDQFHTPRSLAISISIEVAELLEHFQWEESPASTADLMSSSTLISSAPLATSTAVLPFPPMSSIFEPYLI